MEFVIEIKVANSYWHLIFVWIEPITFGFCIKFLCHVIIIKISSKFTKDNINYCHLPLIAPPIHQGGTPVVEDLFHQVFINMTWVFIELATTTMNGLVKVKICPMPCTMGKDTEIPSTRVFCSVQNFQSSTERLNSHWQSIYFLPSNPPEFPYIPSLIKLSESVYCICCIHCSLLLECSWPLFCLLRQKQFWARSC